MASRLSIRKAQVHVPDTCVWCNGTQNVNWYCNDCQEALCNSCKEGHKRGKKTRNDDVVPIRQANKHGQAVLPEVCNVHPGKTCDLFCTDCEIAICSMCFTTKHKQHAFKHFEDEVDAQKEYIRDQLKTLTLMLDKFNEKISNRQKANKTFRESVDIISKDVKERGTKLKAEVDSIVDSVLAELSSLVAEENKSLGKYCQHDEKNVKEIKQLIREVEQQSEKPYGEALFELAGRLRTTIPLYNITVKNVLPRPPRYIPGQLNKEQLKAMVGQVQVGYEKEINSQHVRKLATFQVLSKDEIISICPIDDTYAWISVFGSLVLPKVNNKGQVTKSVKLDFSPRSLALTKSEVLMTRNDDFSLIHKMSKDRGSQVKTFADISPFIAWNISVNDTDNVFVSTTSITILVLNMSGQKVRELSYGQGWGGVICLTGGSIAVTVGNSINCEKLNIINKSDQLIRTWSGELDNGQKLSQTRQNSIACDAYDRLFLPDLDTNKVYIISGNERKAKCIIDEKHGVKDPTAVSVDRSGHIWVGCIDGTVHVMQLWV